MSVAFFTPTLRLCRAAQLMSFIPVHVGIAVVVRIAAVVWWCNSCGRFGTLVGVDRCLNIVLCCVLDKLCVRGFLGRVRT